MSFFCSRCGTLLRGTHCGDEYWILCNRCGAFNKRSVWSPELPINWEHERIVIEQELERVKEEKVLELKGEVVKVHERQYFDIYEIHFKYSYGALQLKPGDALHSKNLGYGVVVYSDLISEYGQDIVRIYAGFRKTAPKIVGREIFTPASSEYLLTLQLKVIEQATSKKLPPHLEELTQGPPPRIHEHGNPFQAAIETAASLEQGEYMLIHGPPGTGKTEAISRIAINLAENGYRVLITSHTNIAVDNALERILSKNPSLKERMARIGHPVKVLSGVRELLTDLRQHNRFDVAPYSIVGMTISMCGVIWDYNIPKVHFDYVVIDEASMATPSQTLLALQHGERYILVGDHKQLPPIITSSMSEKHYEALFTRLIKKHPEKAIHLKEQRRCHPEISHWSRSYIYTDLKDHPRTSSYKLNINQEQIPAELREILNPDKRAVLVKLPATHHLQGRTITGWAYYGRDRSCCNLLEAAIAAYVAKTLSQLGEKPAIIAPFRLQRDLIKHLLTTRGKAIDLALLELQAPSIRTIDSFQGREHNTIILATTEPRHSTLQDYRRLNVAVTRARHKLIILATQAQDTTLPLKLLINQIPHKTEATPLLHSPQIQGLLQQAEQALTKLLSEDKHPQKQQYTYDPYLGWLKREEKEFLRHLHLKRRGQYYA